MGAILVYDWPAKTRADHFTGTVGPFGSPRFPLRPSVEDSPIWPLCDGSESGRVQVTFR